MYTPKHVADRRTDSPSLATDGLVAGRHRQKYTKETRQEREKRRREIIKSQQPYWLT